MNILTPTADGSNTFFNPQVGEHYHSAHGAVQESKHVFVNAGLVDFLTAYKAHQISIFEVGFGTGLNFLLTLDYCLKHDIKLQYIATEAFPLDLGEIKNTGYQNFVMATTWDMLTSNYQQSLVQPTWLHPQATLQIAHQKLANFIPNLTFDVVYYDAFSVKNQPEMWTDKIIAHTGAMIKPAGYFVTYAINGNLKRALKSCGFSIQKLPGAPGKREMLRAVKL